MRIFHHPKIPLVVGMILLTIIIGYVALYKSSPGDLSASHQKIVGAPIVTNCNKCHADGGFAEGCTSCHHEIKAQLASGKGYHPYLLKGKPLTCTPCHPEHQGEALDLMGPVAWVGLNYEKFDHPHVKYGLSGKHDALKCEECHGKAPPFALKDYKKMKRKRTFLSLSQKCSSCHKDPHANGAADDCASCHDQKGWKPAPFFDHDKHYPLRKGHKGVDCKKCHVPPAPGLPVEAKRPFTKSKGKTCKECHGKEDPHRTDWKKNCEHCHDADARPWKEGEKKVTAVLHELTGYSLQKPHDKAKCADCHKGTNYAARYPNPRGPGYARDPERCESCHKDSHGGQFLKKYPRCRECHQRTTFKNHHFTEKEHTQYRLIGGHAKKACEKCHLRDRLTKVRKFVGTSQSCAACHRDHHEGQLKVKGKTRCEDCHRDVGDWRKTLFDHNKQSRFKLDQAHAKVKCEGCHPKVRSKRTGKVLFLYKPLKRKCRDCHEL